MAEKKTTYITSSIHTMLPSDTATSHVVAPGERVVLDEENASHKFLRNRIESGDPDYEHLTISEVSRKDEAKADEERQEQLEKAEKIAAEVRQEQAQEALDRQQEIDEAREQAEEEGNLPQAQQTEFPPQDEEAQRLARESGPGQRASTQEDVVEETTGSGGKSGRRSSRSGGSKS
jgi:arginine/lysine/ornithine decarboxylase